MWGLVRREVVDLRPSVHYGCRRRRAVERRTDVLGSTGGRIDVAGGRSNTHKFKRNNWEAFY